MWLEEGGEFAGFFFEQLVRGSGMRPRGGKRGVVDGGLMAVMDGGLVGCACPGGRMKVEGNRRT